MDEDLRRRLERSAALVERAYRMALVLHDLALHGAPDAQADAPLAFERIAISTELVDLLDEARSAGVVPMGQAQG